MYNPYGLQVYDYVQKNWIKVAHIEYSSKPHYYDDVLRPEFERLVKSAKYASPNQKPIGYRIVHVSNGRVSPVDTWTNGKV